MQAIGESGIRIETLENNTVYYIDTVQIENNKGYLFLKRLFDIVVSLCAGMIVLIPCAVIGIIVRLESPGPAIFKQERLGLNGKPFTIYKFRSMRMDAEQNGPQWATENDDRCTKFGTFLRKTRLDELPQLWNILVGDMSFVGPRPERAVFYDEFETYIHGFRQRLLVKPGLTGHAQINGGYDLKPEKKIVFDIEYMKNRSLAMDFSCILKTVQIVFTHKGAR